MARALGRDGRHRQIFGVRRRHHRAVSREGPVAALVPRLFGLAIFALSVWRAATLSITIDEAYTCNEFVAQGFRGVFEKYDANNHVLHSALVWIVAGALPLSEFAVRIPALCGSLLYLACLLRLIERICFPGQRWLQWLAYAVLTANPLILDLLCLARGYSLALGFLAFALLRLLDYFERERPADLRWMSLALALSVASNLSFAFAAAAALCVALGLIAKFGSWRRALKPALLPGLATAAALLALPLSQADRDHFYWGAKSVADSVETTAAPFLQHHPVDPGPFGSRKIMNRFKWRFLPVALLVLALATLRWLSRGQRGPLVVVACVFFIALFGHWLAHAWLGILYPSERTGAALVVLFFVSFVGALSFLARYRSAALLLALPSALILVALLAQFAQQFDPRYTWAWHGERDNRRIAALLREHRVRNVSAHWMLRQSLEFYRRAGLIPTAAPLPHFGGDKAPWTGYDAYVLYKPDAARLAASGLDVQYRNDVTGVQVAFPR